MKKDHFFRFPLCGVLETLNITVSDGYRLERIASSTGLNRVTAKDFSMIFLENAASVERGTKVGQEDCRRRFAHTVGISLEEKHGDDDEDEEEEEEEDLDIVDRKPTFLNATTREGLRQSDAMLTSLYKSLDREKHDKAFIIEICSALSVCCMGAKSHKLATAFDLCSEGTGRLTRHGLFLFLRSFLSAIVSIQSCRSITDEDIDSTCAEAVGIVFSSTASSNSISFAQFASWYEFSLSLSLSLSTHTHTQQQYRYNGEGFARLQWLELIDGMKWPHVVTYSNGGSMPTTTKTITTDTFEFELDLQPKFYFNSSNKEEEQEDENEDASSSNRLRVLPSDISQLQFLLQDLRRDQCVPKQIARLLEAKSLGASVVSAYDAYDILAQAFLTKSCTSKSIDKLTEILTHFVIDDEDGDYDDHEEVFCDISELAIAMSILGTGRKSEKLILGFEYLALSSSNSSYLTLKSLRIMLLSYLKIICALTSSSTSTSDRSTILNRVVSAVIDAIAVFTNLSDEMSTITFEEFSEWYNNGGSEIATWIELVDMEKWFTLVRVVDIRCSSMTMMFEYDVNNAFSLKFTHPHPPTYTPSPTHTHKQQQMPATTNEEEEEQQQNSITETTLLSLFTFNLERYEELNEVLILSKIDTLDPEDIFETLADFVDGEYVSKSQYDECIRILIPVNDNVFSSEQCRKLSVTFSHIFFLFDWDCSGFVRRAEIASGLSVLTSGKKSRKLELAFDAMDLDRDGKLSSAELETYFQCFLTILAFFSGAFSHRDEDEVRSLISSVSRDLVRKLLAEMPFDDNLVSFERFGHWYTQGGFDHASWLELLDLNKWHEAVAFSKNAAVQEEKEEEEEEKEEEEVEEENKIVFAFSISELQLTYSQFDIDSLLAIVDLSGMKHVAPDVVHDMLLTHFKESTTDGDELYRSDFDECVRTIVSEENLDFVEREQLSQVFAEMFQTFSKGSSRVSSRTEIAIGMSFLCRGSKSRKLELAFDALDLDCDGKLEEDELCTYFRCFLTALSMFSGSLVGLGDDEIQCLVSSASEDLRDLVFDDLDLEEDGQISFEEFGTWYTEGGFRIVPWLELLDLGKWKE